MELLKKLFNVFLVVLALISCDVCALKNEDSQQNAIRKIVEKPRTLYDYQTRVAAYKDLIDSKCLLEFLTNNESIITQRLADNGNTWKPLTTSNQLTKREIWRMAGTRISDFCRGFPTYLIKPPENSLETQNDLPLMRRKRDDRHYFVGRVRGQTQSQYLNFEATSQPGKAEAESSIEGTKALVTGTNGMGQAQSQSVPIDCSQCFSSRYQDQNLVYGRQSPERLTRPDYSALRPGHRYTDDNAFPTGPSGRTSNTQGSPEDRYRPGQTYPPGSYPIGPGRSRSGTFGGRLAGEYQSHSGQSGRFSGTFEGSYHSEDSSRAEGQIGEISQEPGYGPQPTPRGPGGYSEPGRGRQRTPEGQWVSPPSSSNTPGGQWLPPPTGPSSITQPGPGVPGHWRPSEPGGPGSSSTRPSQWVPPSTGTGVGPQTGPEDQGRSWTDGKWEPTANGLWPRGPSSTGQGTPVGPGQIGAPGTQWIPYPGSQAGPGGQWIPSKPGSSDIPGGQGIDGKWVPPSVVPGRITQPEGGQWIPHPGGPGRTTSIGGPGVVPSPGSTAETEGGRWIDGKWESFTGGPGGTTQPGGQWTRPSPGGPTSGQTGYWIDGKWVPSPQGPAGQIQPGTGSQTGQWVPSLGGPAGPTQPGTGGQPGQWIDGKWVPSPGGPAGPTQPGIGGQPGQWVSSPGGPAGPTQPGTGGQPGQWIDGKWVPSPGGPAGPTQPGTGGQPGQWVSSPGGPAGPTQPGTGGQPGQWVSSPGGPAGPTIPGIAGQPGQWIDGKWVPSPGPTTAQTGPTVPGGATPWGPQVGTSGQWGPSSTGAGGTGPGSPSWSSTGPSGQWTTPGAGTQAQWTSGAGGGQGSLGVPWSSSVQGGGQPTGPGGQWVSGQPPYVPGGSYPSPGGGYYSGPGQYVQTPPGQYVQTPPGQYVQTPPGQYVQTPPGQFVQGPGQLIDGKWVPAEADDSDSQVLTSVHQTNNESITASAQAHGKYQGATAQSQVSGTYSGTGSFSASAGSDDGKRGALTQVSGGKDGALSSAQGRGGVGQSQAEVSLDAETGDTLSSAQTSGKTHGTQTQVHASDKGGLADAQANGPGPTSSQAQIGFTPYEGQEVDNQTSPFKGGGTAAAQSGTNTGMTQTQIQGKFRYGIRYQGAAQAGAGSTALRNLTEPTGFFKPLNFTARKVNATRQHKGQSQSQQAAVALPPKTTTPAPTLTGNSSGVAGPPPPAKNQTERDINREKLFDVEVHPMTEDDQVVISPSEATLPPDLDEDPEYADEDYEEDDEEEVASTKIPDSAPLAAGPSRRNLEPSWATQQHIDSFEQPRESSPTTHEKQHIVLENLEPARSSQSVVSQSDTHQKQHIVLDPLEDLDATVHQSKGESEGGMVLQPGQVIPGSPGFQIPAGFRGRVTAIANGPNTYAIGKNAQAQSVTLSPGSGKIYYSKPSNPLYGVVTKTTYKNGQYGTGYSYQPIYHPVGYRVRSGKVLPNFVSVSKSEAGSRDLTTGHRRPDVYYTQSSSCGVFTNTCVYSNGKKTCFPVRKTNPDGTPMIC